MINIKIDAAGYKASEKVIKGVDLKGFEGELIIVGGASGSGKTSLLLTMSGVLKSLLGGWVEGSAIVNGVDVLKAESLTVASLLGLVLQDPEKQVLMPTPLDEVLFTLENLGYEEGEAMRIARRILERFGLSGKELMHVEGLSGGEKRRLTLASAIPHNPYLVMLDEPTASMDPWGIREVRRYIAELIRGNHTVVVVEHKIKYFADLAEKLILMDGGRKVSELRGDELRSKNLLIKLRDVGVDAEPIHLMLGRKDVKKMIGETILEVRDLECWYDSGKPIVRDVSFELRKGEIIALVGPNGSGKTTLLKTISGFHKHHSGEIRVRGDVKKVFYVHQTPDYMFLESTVEKELKHVAAKTGLAVEVLTKEAPFLHAYRFLSPYRLSLGQRRWLTLLIARAYRSELILLDEPTAGLDLNFLKEFFRIIESMSRKGISFIISTHDPRVLSELVDRALIMEEGRVREADPFKVALMLESIAGVY
ncbi:MAG: ATP-binding cassette domain-containing protein [Zestosphaera sp.]